VKDLNDCAHPSVNSLAAAHVDALVRDSSSLRIRTSKGSGGATVVDAGIGCPGGLEAGRRIAEICLGGLGSVSFVPDHGAPHPAFQICVHTAQPVIACLGAQYAGWSLAVEDYKVLGSGPARALGSAEPLFDELGYRDRAERAVLVLEADALPPDGLIESVASDCGLTADRVALVVTPTSSLAGTVQIVARVVEVAMHKLHELGFPLDRVVDAVGAAPLPPPAPDFVAAMGRTNDAIIFAGTTHLFVTGPDDDAADLAAGLPSTASAQFGTPFADLFAKVGGDFYALDGGLFAPAAVTVTALDSGRSFAGGRVDRGHLAYWFA